MLFGRMQFAPAPFWDIPPVNIIPDIPVVFNLKQHLFQIFLQGFLLLCQLILQGLCFSYSAKQKLLSWFSIRKLGILTICQGKNMDEINVVVKDQTCFYLRSSSLAILSEISCVSLFLSAFSFFTKPSMSFMSRCLSSFSFLMISFSLLLSS